MTSVQRSDSSARSKSGRGRRKSTKTGRKSDRRAATSAPEAVTEQRVEQGNDTADPRLLAELAGYCRGRTLVIAEDGSALATAVRDRGLRSCDIPIEISELSNGAGGELALPVVGSFATVVLVGVLERLPVEAGDRLLSKAWEHVANRGRLLVAVPNEDCIPDPAQVRFLDRRKLKKQLRPLGSYHLCTGQPFKWLVAYVKKRAHERTRENRPLDERYRVSAELCHGRVIDLGCGPGLLTELIRDRGLEVVGVDINAEKIRAARERCPDISFIQSDIRDLALVDEAFDTVLLAEVLEHLPEGPGGEILERAGRLLKPGGRLIVSVPNEDSIPHPNHVRQFDRRSLEQLLRPFGVPQLVTDQPFKWLMMYVEKAAVQ